MSSDVVMIVVVGVASVLTSILSAVAGLGGGVILLLVIAQFVAPTTAIPIQGAIQLASNGSRAALLRHHVDRRVVFWSSLLILPGSFVGVAVATALPEDAIRVALAVFVLLLAWRPELLKPTPRAGDPTDGSGQDRRALLLGVGATSGFLNTTVGASGPVTSPFLKVVTTTHVAFVATAAAMQVFAHLAKLAAFTAGGWNLLDHLPLIAVGIVGVVAGSRIGTRLMPKMSATRLDLLFKTVLTTLALRLMATAILEL